MRQVHDSIDISVATPVRTWEMITALRYLHLWFPEVEAVTLISTQDIQLGTTFRVIRRDTKDDTWLVTEWQPPQRLCFREQDRDASWIFDLESSEQGTCVTLTYQWSRGGLAARLMPSTFQHRIVRESLNRLQELIDFNRDIALLHGIGDE